LKVPNKNIPDFLAIGHACYDLVGEDYVLGGAVSFTSQVALKLEKSVAVLTSVEKDFLFNSVFENIYLENVEANKDTIFENVYLENKRTQYLHQKANDLRPEDLPESWLKIPLVLLCPIADEVSFDFLEMFPDSVVACAPQGWMRTWGKDKKVKSKNIDWTRLAKAEVIIMSEEDIVGFEYEIPRIASLVKVLILTRGEYGARLFYENKQTDFPACAAKVVDPTGAGDVFTVTFLLNYIKEKEVHQSVAYANVAASLSIEKMGIAGLPKEEEIQKRLLNYFY